MRSFTQILHRHRALGLILGVVLVIGLLFPFLFILIDQGSPWKNLLLEFVLTPLRLCTIALLVYLVIQAGNRVFPAYPNHWLRHLVQFIVIVWAMYWFLYGFYIWIDLPLSCADCEPNTNSFSYRRYIGLYSFGAIFLYGFVSGINFYEKAKKKATEAEKLQKEYAQVRLQALKSQVNPHFLFNSLSVLSELVKKDPELSEQFIFYLSKAYRYILEQEDTMLVTLKEELEFLDAYFFLLQIRFGNKIVLEKQLSPSCLHSMLPPLTLQLLIENAVKHNKMSEKEPLVIQLKASSHSMVVSNPNRPRELPENSTGIGLENIKNRVAHVSEIPVEIIKTQSSFTVTVPLMNNQNENICG